MKNLIFIIGASKFGASCANVLSENGKDVIIIDVNEESFNKLDTNFGGMKILGNALDLKFLEETDIKTATKVIVCMKDDNMNLFIANVCNDIFKVPKVYIRLNKKGKSGILKGSNITPIYPFKLALDYLMDLFGKEEK